MHLSSMMQAKVHASLIESFGEVAAAQILTEGEHFLEDRARQLKQQAVQNKIQIAKTDVSG